MKIFVGGKYKTRTCDDWECIDIREGPTYFFMTPQEVKTEIYIFYSETRKAISAINSRDKASLFWFKLIPVPYDPSQEPEEDCT